MRVGLYALDANDQVSKIQRSMSISEALTFCLMELLLIDEWPEMLDSIIVNVFSSLIVRATFLIRETEGQFAVTRRLHQNPARSEEGKMSVLETGQQPRTHQSITNPIRKSSETTRLSNQPCLGSVVVGTDSVNTAPTSATTATAHNGAVKDPVRVFR